MVLYLLERGEKSPKIDSASCVRSQKRLDPKPGLPDPTAHVSSTSALYCSHIGGRMPREIEKDLLEADERQSKDRQVPKLPLQQLLLGYW